jgi:hypothetical protein
VSAIPIVAGKKLSVVAPNFVEFFYIP